MTARILLVRDGDLPAATVERLLARDYAEIRFAQGWGEAEAALAAEAFDLAVLGAGGCCSAACCRGACSSRRSGACSSRAICGPISRTRRWR